MNQFLMKNARTLALLALLIPAAAQGADPGDNYCVTPPFISGGIKPNLLLMIDSSASMYDMGYIAGSTSAAPTYSCTGITEPVTQQYCFDNTYNDGEQYEGYFSKIDSAGALVYPVYQYSSAEGKFVEITTGIPTGTGDGIYSTSYFHITMSGSGSTRAVSSFVASGKFLNWLAASKFDIQKKILTGGKYVSDASGGALVGESRGCVGRRFVKTVPGVTGITFAVRGPTAVEPLYEASTQGGETKIEIFEGRAYNATDCTCAVANWTSGNFGQAQTNTADCLGATPSDQALAALNHTQQLCWQIKQGANVTTLNTQALETSCLRLYDTTDPATLTNESNGNYICTSAATHATPTGIYAGTFASDTTGFLGTCTRGNSTNRFNDVTCVQRELLHYCMGVNFSEVTDPSSAVGTTGNIPAVIMDAGVRAIGAPVGTFNGRVGVSSQPTGVINEFSGSIRFGAMTFFPFGSKSEWNTSSNPTKISRLAFCSGKPTKVCTVGGSDCKTGEGSCEYASDKDAGVILSPIGTSVGDHTTANTVVKAIDDVVAKSWTPFAEAYYNAIAYFVKDATATTATLNTTKFTPTAAAIQAPLADTDSYTNQNPIQFRCQQNNILLITDGSSTADRNETMRNKVTDSSDYFRDTTTKAAEDAVAGVCGDYSGSPYLHDLSKFAYNRNIFNPSQLCRGTGATACENAQMIKTHVVFNAPATASTDVCDSYRQMSLTATNGGTTIKNPNNPIQLRADLKATLESIAAGAASGTAASILSNSEGSGANILQAVFYPKKVFAEQTEAKWIGEMQNLWYFVDPQINRSTIREDTDQDNIFNLVSDHVVSFRFDSNDNTTYAYTSIDQNGDGSGDTAEVKQDADSVKSIWRAGKKLWARSLTGTGVRKIKTSINGTSLIDFSSSTFLGSGGVDNSTTLAPYLDVADAATANKLINYVHGVEQTGYRSRTVSIRETPTSTPVSGVWRLGDIISSTPRIQSNLKLNTYNLQAPSGYSDSSYQSYIGSKDYGKRGMVYVGANDGMLHAFNFGKLDVTASGTQKATLEKLETTDPALGEEMWAYIPKQALPYLKYYADPNYNHLYYVDGATVLFDAAIGAPSDVTGCTDENYYNCDKLNSVVDANNNLVSTKNPWRSILIGGMGLGGASSSSCSDPATNNCVPTPRTDPADDTKGLGLSSYFALDVSNPKSPSLLWEFKHENLGFATTGPAIVRVGGKGKNGRWFAVFGSGPTGPVDTDGNQFQGRSNQRLKFFVVDLKTGALVGEPLDSEIDNAFAGSMIGASIDTDRWNPSAGGNYQDDAILVGFTKKTGTGASATWTDGGVIRILTKDDPDPSHWAVSKVIDGVGPVVTAIARLQDRKNMNLWYYFGTGRYYYRAGSSIDDYSSQRSIYGLKDPCYNTDDASGNRLDPNCSTTTISAADITDQSSDTPSSTIGSGGWKIDLDESTTAFGAERVVSDLVTLTNGTVFATTFEPTSDACGFGGNSFLWALGYNTGDRPSDAALSGKALIQLSTGEFKEVDLAQAFGSGATRAYRRSSTPMTGKPPADAFPVVSKSANKPVKKILHIQER